MTADRGPGTRSTTKPIGASPFATTEAELFDVDAVPLTTREARSVGEMLADVDHQARQLLMDVDGDAAAGLLRGWPALVAAAEELWTAMPRSSDTLDRPMERLAAHAASIGASLATGWPGPGDADPRITHLAETLHTAAALVRRYGGEISAHLTPVRQDLEAARTRTMHGLYVTAHAANVALHAHGRDHYWQARDAGRRVALSEVHSPYAIAPTTRWIGRLATAETIAGDYLIGRFATAVAGEARRPLDDHNRIPRALAGWDIQAHRTLTANPSPANNVIIARTQALIAGVGVLLTDAAVRTHRGDVTVTTPSSPERLSTALSAAGPAWSNLAGRWNDLHAPNERYDPQLMRAAAEVRAAYRELTHDATTLSGPEVIATRPGLDRALQATLAAIETGPELAEVLAEKANTPGLVGRARALSVRAHNDIEAGLATPDPEGDVVWVSPADIHARRLVPLPPPVAETLRLASNLTISASRTIAAAAAITHSQDLKRGASGAETPATSGASHAKNHFSTNVDARDRCGHFISPR